MYYYGKKYMRFIAPYKYEYSKALELLLRVPYDVQLTKSKIQELLLILTIVNNQSITIAVNCF